ncbi:TM2 domain-containing protein [Corynebacterium phoceense]|uniref:TM2 domain-containing protein n=1 Tax=Corynebacterium phoceense TaxID=1686286 RepID=UPI00211C756D|nr:TM2 domain-containing protein [Corynebacterium phoceense]MCQ9340170.1 TM2 domain-containing protein [Corynebacterium phoceense]
MSNPYDPNQQVNANFPVNPIPGQGAQPQYVIATTPKSKAIAAILALFLGGLGIHNFYIGRNLVGVLQLVFFLAGGLIVIPLIFVGGIGFLLPIAFWIWILVEFVLILLGVPPFDRDSRGLPLE